MINLVIYIPLLVCLIALVVYRWTAKDARTANLALYAFAVALLVTLMNGGKLFLR